MYTSRSVKKPIHSNRSVGQRSDLMHMEKLVNRIKELERENAELRSYNKKLLDQDNNSTILSTGLLVLIIVFL